MKPSIKFGLINAGVGVLWAMIMYVTGLNRNASAMWIQFFGIIVPIICIVQATKVFRETEGNGYNSFGQTFRIGFMITSIGAVIGGIYHFIFLKFIDPTFIDFQMNQQLEKLQEKGLSEEMIDSQIQMTGKFMTPIAQFGFAIVFGLIFSALTALIMAAIIKKPNPDEIS